MVKFVIGLLIGSFVVAVADDYQTSILLGKVPLAYLNAGVPDGQASAIKVDVDGYVICSATKPK